jgi:2-polyprenyl-6-methoxyphenol hydroxylase-like FAD-dependent oxidoreductase
MRKLVIIGGGFAGLECARKLANDDRFEITLLDRTNHHLFQPLLYQVASASLAAPDIARSIRQILADAENATVLMDEISTIDTAAKQATGSSGTVYPYDTLLLAAGATRLVEVMVTLTGKMDARDAAELIPVSLKAHLTDAVRRKNAERAGEIDGLIREASDAAEEKATALVALEKVHGPKPEDSAVAVKHLHASRESLLADAEVERLRNLRSARPTYAIT